MRRSGSRCSARHAACSATSGSKSAPIASRHTRTAPGPTRGAAPDERDATGFMRCSGRPPEGQPGAARAGPGESVLLFFEIDFFGHLDDLATSVEALGTDVVAAMNLAGLALFGKRRLGDAVVRTAHAATRGGLAILLYGHFKRLQSCSRQTASRRALHPTSFRAVVTGPALRSRNS